VRVQADLNESMVPVRAVKSLRNNTVTPSVGVWRGCVGTDSEGNYRRQGRWDFFHPNGEQRGEGSYVDGIPVGGETDFTGLPSDGPEGLWVVWYTNGQRRFEGRCRDGELEGFSTEWFANGQKWSEATYLNGTRTSRTEWDESGNQTRAD
jgi:antitoxin component YwqK of YwqJK toxin-antitoxin module